jgi:cytoskeletal protein RodZ
MILGFIAALVIALFLFQKLKQSPHSSRPSTIQSNQSKLLSSTALPSPAKEALHDIFDGITTPSATSNTSKHVASDAKTRTNQDPRLRMFDEL